MMFMKTSNLTVLSDDIDENKPLNTRSALAQREMISGLVDNRLFAATRVYLAQRRLEAASARAPLRPAGWCRARLRDSSLSSTNIAEFHCDAPARQNRGTENRQPTTDKNASPRTGEWCLEVGSSGIKEMLKMKVDPNG
jgi:hypothetical protein